jgi:hypothetical protein
MSGQSTLQIFLGFYLSVLCLVQASSEVTFLYSSVEVCKDIAFGFGGRCSLNSSCVGGALSILIEGSATCQFTSVGDPVSVTILGATETSFYYTEPLLCNNSLESQISYCNSGSITDHCNANIWAVGRCYCGYTPQITVGSVSGLQSMSVMAC